jgi:anti-sigma28 factor (negative regulator of flagellin synthesis)
MSIRSIGNPYGAQRPVAPATSRPAAAAESTTAAPAASRRESRGAGDSVAISADARALATGRADAPGAAQGARAPLTAERVDELRRKVLEGAYNQTQVVDQVAKRLLASGDV